MSGNTPPPIRHPQGLSVAASPSSGLPEQSNHRPGRILFPQGRTGRKNECKRRKSKKYQGRTSAACALPALPKTKPGPRQDQPHDNQYFNAIGNEGPKHDKPASTKPDDRQPDGQHATRCAKQSQQARTANKVAVWPLGVFLKSLSIRHHGRLYASCSYYRSKRRLIT